MKKLFRISLSALLVAFVAFTAFAQESRSFNVSGFNRLAMGSAFKIDVKQGSSFSVKASGRSEDIQDLQATVSGGELKLGYKGNNWNKNRKTVNVSIIMPNLQGIDFSGASTATVASFSGVKNMEIEVSGASRVTMDLKAQKVDMELSGASSLALKGKCETLNGEVSGASSFKGSDFQASEVNIDASGASGAAVYASNVIHAKASGASSIRYSGSVKDVRSSTSGASSVKRD